MLEAEVRGEHVADGVVHRAAREDVTDGREREVDEDHGGGQEGHDEPAARGSHGVEVAVPDGRCADDAEVARVPEVPTLRELL